MSRHSVSCPRCGSELVRIEPSEPHVVRSPEVYACPACGEKLYSEVLVIPAEWQAARPIERVRVQTASLRGYPDRVLRLRERIARFRDVPMDAMLEEIRSADHLELGDIDGQQIEELRSFGLVLEVT